MEYLLYVSVIACCLIDILTSVSMTGIRIKNIPHEPAYSAILYIANFNLANPQSEIDHRQRQQAAFFSTPFEPGDIQVVYRQSCPRVTFLVPDPTRPDPTRQNVDPTRPAIADQKSDPTRPAARSFPHMHSLYLNNNVLIS